jgi:hypothetical protein
MSIEPPRRQGRQEKARAKSDNRRGAKAQRKAAKNFRIFAFVLLWFSFASLCAFAVAFAFDSFFLAFLAPWRFNQGFADVARRNR